MFDIFDKRTYKELIGRNVRITTSSCRFGVPPTDIVLLEGIVTEADPFYISMREGKSIASTYPNITITFLDEFQTKRVNASPAEVARMNFEASMTGRFSSDRPNLQNYPKSSYASFLGGDSPLPDAGDDAGGEG